MKTAYSYIRFSTEKQSKGASHARQIEKAQKYCVSHGLTLDTHLNLFDEGVSAFSGKNLQAGSKLGKFLMYCESGKIKTGSTLLIESFDRLSRQNIDEAQGTLRRILQTGVNVVTLADERVYTRESLKDPLAVISAILIMSRANEESERKSERVGDAWARKRKAISEGKILTSKCPEWLNVKDGKFVTIPDRVAIIKEIFEMAAGGWGKIKIMKELNRRGIPAFRGKLWATSSIKTLLHNRSLIGEFQPHRKPSDGRIKDGEVITGYFPTVIDENLFNAIQHTVTKAIPGPTSNKNLFTGMIKCQKCGSPIHYVDKGHNWQYLVCSRASRGGDCDYKAVRYDKIEKFFFHWCINSLNIESFQDKKILGELKNLKMREISLQEQIKKNRIKLQNVMENFSEATDDETRVSCKALIAKISEQITTDKQTLEQLTAEITEKQNFSMKSADSINILKNFETVDRHEMRRAIIELVDYMLLTAEGGIIISLKHQLKLNTLTPADIDTDMTQMYSPRKNELSIVDKVPPHHGSSIKK
jgi:DNA invertase Pin-like site-specific DNA recombinase